MPRARRSDDETSEKGLPPEAPRRGVQRLSSVQTCSGKGTMATKARVLLVGLEPDIVDFSKSPVPGLTAAKVRAAVEADSAKLELLGYSVKSLYVDDGKTAEVVLANALAAGGYDCIMIGAGLRIVPPYFLLFEKLINVIHQHAPASTKLCFNTNPTDTADAVQRWV
jgi:hypothetical protein